MLSILRINYKIKFKFKFIKLNLKNLSFARSLIRPQLKTIDNLRAMQTFPPSTTFLGKFANSFSILLPYKFK